MDIVVAEDQNLLVISENGYGKATKTSNFPSHKRGGVGIKAAVVTSKTGPIIAVHTVVENTSEILLISTEGQAIRVGLKDIPTLGRTTQGVRIMRVNDGDKVASIGLMPEQDKEEDSENIPETPEK
jgi:DNA gyrase subunit A